MTTPRRTQPTAKSGDPKTDRAVRDAAAKVEAPAKSAPAPEAEANGKAPAPAKAEPGHRRYATAEVPSAMVGFTKWIRREFPEWDTFTTERQVTISSKAYRYFQSSDLNR